MRAVGALPLTALRSCESLPFSLKANRWIADWPEAQITAEATKQFDAAAQAFFTAAVVACKLTRPGGKVGCAHKTLGLCPIAPQALAPQTLEGCDLSRPPVRRLARSYYGFPG